MPAGTTPCTICDGPMQELWPSAEYCYFVCRRCEFVRVAPVPQTKVLKDYYANAYEVDRESYRRNIRRHGCGDVELLGQFCRTGRMLEVGSSWGFFLEAARQRGWQVQGIELSNSAANWATEKLGLEVTCGTIEDFAKLEHAAFDVIVAWHVVEHVQDPVLFLKIVHDLLRPGGLLALRTPNVRSAPARLNGWAWQWVGAPAHLSLFSPKSLVLSVEQAGFSVRHKATRRGDALNPVFEVLRASALRAGLHQHIKRLLKLQGRNEASALPDGDCLLGSRRVRMLGRMSRFLDLTLFALYPVEKLLDFAGLGAELFLLAERN